LTRKDERRGERGDSISRGFIIGPYGSSVIAHYGPHIGP